MILMIDNYDSFTYNLVQYLGELGVEVHVYRNDEIDVAQAARLGADHIVISPGPCTPSMIYHRSQGVFAGLDQPFEATRYHSLVLDPESIPDTLSVMAWTEYQGGHEIMGIKHKQFNVQGVQFHPESILTTSGHALLKNFLQSISLQY